MLEVANYSYSGNRITVYKCTELACPTPQIYTMLYVKYMSVKISFSFKMQIWIVDSGLSQARRKEEGKEGGRR